MQLTDWAVFIPALTFVSGLIGLAFQRNKTKKEVDNFVITGAEGVVKMYEQLVLRLSTEVTSLRAERIHLKDRVHLLEQVLRSAGIEVPHHDK